MCFDKTMRRGPDARMFFRIGRVVVTCAVALFIATGCRGITYVALGPDHGVRSEFRTLQIDLQGYAFFTAGPEADPDAILAIEPPFLDAFNPKGWKPRDQNDIPDLIKGLLFHPYKGLGYGMLVKDETGEVKGKLYTIVPRHTVFVYPEKGVFTVQTPNMVSVEPSRYLFLPVSDTPTD